jgi:hypothetical protein
MSWSLQVSSGDLNFLSRGAGAEIVTGKVKTYQDLRNWLLETMGNDPMHPDYGSILDGGVMPTGAVVQSMVGRGTIHDVEQEITRVIRSVMDVQGKRIDRDMAVYGKMTLSDSEIIQGIKSIESKKFGTKLVVRVNLTMRNNVTVSMVQPIG